MSDHAVKNKKPEILEEEDAPFDDTSMSESEISSKKVKDIEAALNAAKGFQTITLKNNGFRLIVICISLAAGTYGLDCWFINNGMVSSSLTTGFFELLKFIITILVGFVFAKNAEK